MDHVTEEGKTCSGRRAHLVAATLVCGFMLSGCFGDVVERIVLHPDGTVDVHQRTEFDGAQLTLLQERLRAALGVSSLDGDYSNGLSESFVQLVRDVRSKYLFYADGDALLHSYSLARTTSGSGSSSLVETVSWTGLTFEQAHSLVAVGCGETVTLARLTREGHSNVWLYTRKSVPDSRLAFAALSRLLGFPTAQSARGRVRRVEVVVPGTVRRGDGVLLSGRDRAGYSVTNHQITGDGDMTVQVRFEAAHRLREQDLDPERLLDLRRIRLRALLSRTGGLRTDSYTGLPSAGGRGHGQAPRPNDPPPPMAGTGSRTLAGRVLVGANALAGSRVSLYSVGEDGSFTLSGASSSNENGEYRVEGLAPRDYALQVHLQGESDPRWMGQVSIRNAQLVRRDISLGLGSVRVRLESDDVHPIGRAVVWLHRADSSQRFPYQQSLACDENGTAHFRHVEFGSYRISYSAGFATGESVSVSVGRLEPDQVVRVPLGSSHGVVTVRATDRDGRPMRAVIRVLAMKRTDSGDTVVRTNEKGVATVRLRPGRWKIGLYTDVHDQLDVGDDVFRRHATLVTVKAGGSHVVALKSTASGN